MAGGKLSPRQKMVNLMYLVFIAMLALNMDKKVLTSIGLGIEDNIEANTRLSAANTFSLSELSRLATEQPEKYATLSTSAQSLSGISNKFSAYLDTVQDELKATLDEEERNNYEVMDGADAGDEYFFAGEKFTKKGQEFVDKISNYREAVLKILGTNGNPTIIASVKKRFNTSDDILKGQSVKWLISRFEGYPLVSTLSNISRIKAGVKATESEAYGSLVANQMTSDVSMTNYDAMVIFDKNAYYPGEKLSGKIVLGKNDPSLKASKVVINGNEVKPENIKAGQVILSGTAGNVGEHELRGTFHFMEDGKDIPIEIIGGKYSVIPKPNSAVIAADKMNVVYRNLPNPMTVSIPGIPDNLVKASASGLRKVSGTGKYMMTPGKGKIVKIVASGTLPDGSKVSSSKTFRIKDIPKPLATVRKESGYVKMPKSSLVKTTVRVELPDFLFDLKFKIKSFKVKVPGKATITVSGSKMNGQAQSAINGARVGDIIAIFDVKSSLVGVSGVNVKDASAVSIEIQ